MAIDLRIHIVRQVARRFGQKGLRLVGLSLWSALALIQFPHGQACGQHVTSVPQRHVLVISVDGLGSSWYTAPPPQLRIPNLRRLMAEGSYADAVVGVYPSVTYPSHTTLVTGRLPAEHGIYSNLSSREAGKNSNDWFWFADAIKVPALWDVIGEHGMTSGAVFWPVTARARITWNIPEIWDPQEGAVGDPLYVAKFATPGLLFEAALELGPPKAQTDDDTTRTGLAAFLLKKHRPNLLLVHLAGLDEAEHQHGPRSPEAAAILEGLDTRIGELLVSVREAGLAETTEVFVVSDHGFLPVEREINPNVLLAKAGLLEVDAKGSLVGGKISTVANGGSFFIYWPKTPDLRPEVDAALKPLRDRGLLWGGLTPDAVQDLGGEPAIRLALEAPSGAAFGDHATGELIQILKGTAGTHGYLPTRVGLEASFIAAGPQIRKGVVLRRIPMTAIAPTLIKALGINDPHFGAEPPLVEIFK